MTNQKMEKDKYKTDVIFRKYRAKYNFNKTTIIALFPYEIFNQRGHINCYEFCGQHGEVDYHHVVDTMTTLATDKESRDLKTHLESHFGYDLRVIKKRNHKKFIKLLNK